MKNKSSTDKSKLKHNTTNWTNSGVVPSALKSSVFSGNRGEKQQLIFHDVPAKKGK